MEIYAVCFGSIIAINYKTKEPAVFFSLEKATEYAVEMNLVGSGGYFPMPVAVKVKKRKI